MRLFLKEHRLLLAVQCIQFTFFILILLLSGFKSYALLFYGVFVSFVILCLYLTYYYYSRRHIYQRLSKRPRSLDELLEVTNKVALGQAFDQRMKEQYQLYIDEIIQAENIQTDHLTFIDRWVHQMKTPLSVIELVAQDVDEPEAGNIREEAERIKNGLHTVLHMARLRTIQEDFHIQTVDVMALIHEVNQENKRFYIRNRVYPQINAQIENLIVKTDEKWLYFILDQLLQNAVKYSTGKSNQVMISLREESGEGVIEIKDEGVGIPIHDQKRIFQAFYTGDNGRRFRESTGMGLYLTKSVIDYLGHSLEMESVINEGTTFRIRFTRTQVLSK